MNGPLFEPIPKKRYNPSYGKALIVIGFGFFMLPLLYLNFNLIRILNCATISRYPQILFHFLLGVVFTIQGIKTYFSMKKAETNYHAYYLTHPETNQLENETFCRKCGAVLTSVFYKETNRSFIKPITIATIKGYFCKNCFKKYRKKEIVFFIIVLVISLILFLPPLILCYNYLTSQYFAYLYIVLIFLPLVLLKRTTYMVKRFRIYK